MSNKGNKGKKPIPAKPLPSKKTKEGSTLFERLNRFFEKRGKNETEEIEIFGLSLLEIGMESFIR